MTSSSDAPLPSPASAASVQRIAPTRPNATARRFTLFYKPSAAAILQREIVGTLEEAMTVACAMLRDGSAKHVNLVESGRIDGVVPHSRIVRWCAERTGRP